MSFQGGILKVILGLLVVMKGMRINNLYYYNGSTIIGLLQFLIMIEIQRQLGYGILACRQGTLKFKTLLNN